LNDRLFIGLYPAGIVYADKSHTAGGDYKQVAFLPYRTLTLEIRDAESPLLESAKAHAAGIQAQRGKPLTVSACGQSALLGD
jgi:hypothetical protein